MNDILKRLTNLIANHYDVPKHMVFWDSYILKDFKGTKIDLFEIQLKVEKEFQVTISAIEMEKLLKVRLLGVCILRLERNKTQVERTSKY